MPIPSGAEIPFAGTPSNGVSETQSVSISGVPTGGSFTLAFDGATTAAIAYNASAAVLQASLEAISTIGVGEVACAGGPLPGTAITVTFQNALGGLNVAAMTANSAGLTGGTTPTASVATTTPGVRGTYRGAAPGTILCDITNGVFYEQTSASPAKPTWSELEID